MKRTKLSQIEIDTALDALNATSAAPWSVAEGRLCRAFQFPDFNTAFGFMTRCALVAEAMDHHPTWSNSYGRVDVALSTHSANAVTALDFALAGRMETLAGATRGKA